MKRFTLMMMVMCFLMSIPLKMMAQTVTEDKITVVSHYVTGSWGVNNNFNFTSTDGGKIYTCVLKDVTAENVWFRIVKNESDMQWGPNSSTENLVLTSSYQKAYESKTHKKSFQIKNAQGSTYTITWDNENNQIKCVKEGSGSSTVDWNTVSTNRLTEKPRVYSKGFYLAGNFFSFQPKNGDNQITYDDAVFKFQQQKNDATIESGKDYEVYKVEIPASLKAHAQVMYVDEFGITKNIFGPGTTKGISRTCPNTDKSTDWEEAKVNACNPITQENSNYWNFASRNETKDEYSDGMYNLYIAVDATTHEVKWWKIEHDSDRRVAYIISDAPNATAMPVYDAFDTSHNSDKFSNKFYASVNFSAERNYYVISNYLKSQDYVSWTEHDYETKTNSKDYVSTTNKLFLLGNGGSAYDPSSNTHLFSPNEKPMPGGDLSNIVVEYNPSNGRDDFANNDKHLGFSGQVKLADGTVKIKSVSMVGDAIPGTLKKDGSWDFTSKAADMIYDDVEQCYTTTVVTKVGDGEKHFRFVGNHDPKINWFEDTDGTEPDKMAKTLYTDTKPGHSADSSDPNKVNYTKEGKFSEDKYHIIWNRPAGRWTVRLYFYTRNVDGGKPVTDYYYTINKNSDLVLRDFEDVQYKNEEGKREILKRGGYKFFRTWSDHKAWKISKDVDIFIVDKMTEGTNSVEFSLKKISDSETANVIPAEVGVILATKKDATNIEGGGKFYERPSLTSYNTLVIPMEEYTGEETTANYKDNLLEKMVEAGVVPTYNKDKDEYNYLFGFFRAQKGLNDYTNYTAQQFVLGFWLSQGAGLFYSNSAYLPVKSATAAKMKLGTKYGQFEKDPITGNSKYIPALLFDFANVGGTTGINEVVNQNSKLNDGKYYTLSGQQVEKPTAGGIYIHNGRKFVVK